MPDVSKTQYRCSVLMAAYNAERYIAQSLDSLCAQTLAGVEIIVVDDSSTDATLSIVRHYADWHDNIRWLHLTENHGQAYARNHALNHATGEYVCFLDADDWYAPDALEQAVAVLDNNPETDCVLFDVMMCQEGKAAVPAKSETFDCLAGREAFLKSLTWEIHGVYMVRADIHRRYPYDDTCRCYSDDNTTRLHFYVARQVRSCRGRYYYRQHSSSMTHQISVRHFDHMRANESMKRQLVSLGVDDDILTLYENQRWLVVIDSYQFYFRHRHELSTCACRRGLAEMRRVWRTIEIDRLYARNRYKFGYMPLRSSWQLFCIAEELYFLLKKALKR